MPKPGPKPGKRGYSLQESDYSTSYQQEYVRCHKPQCRRCATGPGHGPYWYAYHYSPAAKRRIKTYLGRELGPPSPGAAGSNVPP
jgi:hypothetical protein